MDEESGRGPGAKGAWPQLLLAALSMGVLMGSIGASRLQEHFGTPLFAPCVRIVCVLFAAVMAALSSRTSPPKPRDVFRCVLALTAVWLAMIALSLALGPDVQFALGVAATISEGISLALLMYLVLCGLMAYGIAAAAWAIALGYVVINLWDSVFVNAAPTVCTVQWVVGKLAAVVLAWLFLSGGLLRGWRSPAADRPSGPEAGQGGAPWAHALAVAAALLVSGVFANLTGIGGVAENAFFDLSVNIYLIVIRLAVLACLVYCGGRVGTGFVAQFGVASMSVGVAAAALLWGTGYRFLGSMAVESALYVVQPLVLVAGVRLAMGGGEGRAPVLFAAIAVVYSNHITRLATPFIVADLGAVSEDVIFRAALLSLCALALAASACMRGGLASPKLPPPRRRERRTGGCRGRSSSTGGSNGSPASTSFRSASPRSSTR